VLAADSDAALAIAADALTEAGHPYGEFLTLHLKGTKAALKVAKRVAATSSRAWLGPLYDVLDAVEYERGVPVAAHFAGSSEAVDAALTHPLLASFKRLLVARHGARREPATSVQGYLTLVRAMLPRALVELDAGSGCIDHLPTLDGRQVTHLHGLDVLAGVPLEASAWPQVAWVEVPMLAGQSLRVLDAVLRDVGGLFAARRPAVALRTPGTASSAELANVRAALSRLRSRAVTLNGRVL
jgi:hypothetical protein